MPKGIKAVHIHEISDNRTLPPDEFSWQTFYPSFSTSSAQAILASSRLVIFDLTDETAEVLLDDHDVITYQISSDGSQITETSSILNEVDNQWRLVWDSTERKYLDNSGGITNGWDASDHAIDLILQRRNYLTASQYIESVFKEWETASPQDVGDRDFFNSCLGYLLGLAYEMQGQKDQAVLAYYDAWRDYPGSMFGMAASAKLEPV